MIFEDRVEFRLHRSKTDPYRTKWPLLIHEDGIFLSHFQFVAIFRKGIRALGFREDQFSDHSFRIGAAMEGDRLVLRDDFIKQIGQWESIHYRSYVRLDGL